MKNTKKYLENIKRRRIERIKDYKMWIKEEENHIHLINKCLDELKNE